MFTTFSVSSNQADEKPGKQRKGKARQGNEKEGKEKKGKARRGKEKEGKEKRLSLCTIVTAGYQAVVGSDLNVAESLAVHGCRRYSNILTGFTALVTEADDIKQQWILSEEPRPALPPVQREFMMSCRSAYLGNIQGALWRHPFPPPSPIPPSVFHHVNIPPLPPSHERPRDELRPRISQEPPTPTDFVQRVVAVHLPILVQVSNSIHSLTEEPDANLWIHHQEDEILGYLLFHKQEFTENHPPPFAHSYLGAGHLAGTLHLLGEMWFMTTTPWKAGNPVLPVQVIDTLMAQFARLLATIQVVRSGWVVAEAIHFLLNDLAGSYSHAQHEVRVFRSLMHGAIMSTVLLTRSKFTSLGRSDDWLEKMIDAEPYLRGWTPEQEAVLHRSEAVTDCMRCSTRLFLDSSFVSKRDIKDGSLRVSVETLRSRHISSGRGYRERWGWAEAYPCPSQLLHNRTYDPALIVFVASCCMLAHIDCKTNRGRPITERPDQRVVDAAGAAQSLRELLLRVCDIRFLVRQT
ncbi:hypothetical protein C8R47DRAFT_1078960 [Mycena vitilis]|nr:hypothetical protein C8R47DRAFT_1078960 [Mycena vitilis]